MILMHGRDEDFVSVTIHPDPTFDSEGGEAPQPTFAVSRTPYGAMTSDWVVELEGVVEHPPLFVPKIERVYLLVGGIASFDLAKEQVLERVPLPIDAMTDWSSDETGKLCLIGYQHDRATLVALTPSGDEAWRWSDPSGMERWVKGLPPLRCPSGRVYAISEGRVLALEEGQLIWDFDVRSQALRHGAAIEEGSFVVEEGRLLATVSIRSATALLDESLLVATQKTLYHLDREGRIRMKLALDEEITAAPVVDDEGRIYLVTVSHLLQIR